MVYSLSSTIYTDVLEKLIVGMYLRWFSHKRIRRRRRGKGKRNSCLIALPGPPLHGDIGDQFPATFWGGTRDTAAVSTI